MRQRKKWIWRRVERLRSSLLEWLEKSEVPSAVLPMIGPSTARGFELSFTQMTKELSVHAAVHDDYSEINVVVDHAGQCWDIILWVDVSVVRQGAYCTCDLCCQQKDRKRFISRGQLYVDHLWEPLWAWLLGNLQPGKVLCLFQTESRGATWAEIVSATDSVAHSKDKTFVYSVPVIKNSAD